MIVNNVELFNVSDIVELDDGTLRPYRFQREVIPVFADCMRDYAVPVAKSTTGCEIRFVGDGADITLRTQAGEGFVEIYRGDFFVKCEKVYSHKDTTVIIRNDLRMDKSDMSGYKGVFDNSVWRVVFGYEIAVDIKSIKPMGEIRPPRACEIPAKKIVAYGSSITHSVMSVLYTNAYIYTLSRRLGCDVLCKGVAGSCFVQGAVIDAIAKEEADAFLLELGVNMVDTDIGANGFRLRAEYAVKTMLATGKKVILISNFTSHHNLPGAPFGEVNSAFIKVIEEIYQQYKCENLYYVPGTEVITDLAYLSADIIHPSPYGHVMMGNRLADKLLIDLGFKL